MRFLPIATSLFFGLSLSSCLFFGGDDSINNTTVNNFTNNNTNNDTNNTNNGTNNVATNSSNNGTTNNGNVELCNNGTIDVGELCDRQDFGDLTCESEAPGTKGELKCIECQVDITNCVPKCGDGILDGGEECDGEKFNGKTCQSEAPGTAGSLQCDASCKLDMTACLRTCDNGRLDPGEQCDGDDFNGKSCESEIADSEGMLVCDACRISTTDCRPKCGNGKLDPGEECDENLQLTETCVSEGYGAGAVTCNLTTCKLDTSACLPIVCGDNVLSIGEECESSFTNPNDTCENLNFGDQFTSVIPSCVDCQYDRNDCQARDLSASVQSACVLDKTDPMKPLECWAYNLGFGTALNSALDPPDPMPEFSQMSVGHRHICGVKLDGTIRCWGRKNGDETGLGFLYNEVTGGMLVNDTTNNKDFVQVSAGTRYSSCGLKTNGSAVCWGDDRVIVQGVGHKYVEAGAHLINGIKQARACVITSADDIQCFKNGISSTRQGTYTQLSLGLSHDCAVRSDGQLRCWDANQMALAPPSAVNNSNFIQVSVAGEQGSRITCGLKSDGRVRCWGGLGGVVNATPSTTKFVEVRVGSTFACGIRKDDGTIECWGPNSFGAISGNPDFCGDGAITGIEECDGSNMMTCNQLGLPDFGPEVPICRPNCLLQKSTCLPD